MKKAAIFLAIVFSINIAHAQKLSFQSAVSSLNKGFLDKARNFIDPCIIDPSTKDWPKTWKYRGDIYLQILLSKEDKYKNLDSNALQIAYDSYQKAIELDSKKEYFDDIKFQLYVCGEQFYNKGVELYTLKKYEDAMTSFDKTSIINGIFGLADTLATYNAALCAELANIPSKAKEYYKKLVKLNYHQPLIYSSLASIYKDDKDTAKALSTIKKGRELYPDNYNLIIAETNIYLSSGKTKEAKDLLEIAIQKDPTNPNLYYAIGTSYDALANDTSKLQKERSLYFTEAESAYKKAIELKADFFDAIYNLGAMYFNDGVRIFQEADKMVNDMTKYNETKVKFEQRWNQALPYLEKALELNSSDYNTLISLKQLYSRTSQMDKLKVINEKLKAIK
ncbi:MAG: tetratricopeptide repeat protein [Bacteroidales bacterium]